MNSAGELNIVGSELCYKILLIFSHFPALKKIACCKKQKEERNHGVPGAAENENRH